MSDGRVNDMQVGARALREAVIEAARQGLRGGARKGRRNPNYVTPSKADRAWTHVYGICRAFSEWASEENIAFMHEGLAARRDDQSAKINAVRQTSELLSQITEDIDAR